MTVDETDRRYWSKKRPSEPGSWEATDVANLMEVEERLMAVVDRLEEHYEAIETIRDAKARAQAAWERHRDMVIIDIASSGKRTSEDVRLAFAKNTLVLDGHVMGSELYEAFLIAEAAEHSARDHLKTLESTLSGLQTVVKGLRAALGIGTD